METVECFHKLYKPYVDLCRAELFHIQDKSQNSGLEFDIGASNNLFSPWSELKLNPGSGDAGYHYNTSVSDLQATQQKYVRPNSLWKTQDRLHPYLFGWISLPFVLQQRILELHLHIWNIIRLKLWASGHLRSLCLSLYELKNWYKFI